MRAITKSLLMKLDSAELLSAKVIPWGSPIPVFGDLMTSKIATLGLNPSNREFEDVSGSKLKKNLQRFHTLDSLGLEKWSDVSDKHIEMVIKSCKEYFVKNPYDGWFKGLDNILMGANYSYYENIFHNACHLDLIPYATTCKWTDLTSKQKKLLLELTSDSLGYLLKKSPITTLILNGRTVVDNLQSMAEVELQKHEIKEWMLPRLSGKGVSGFAYFGHITHISGVDLGKEIKVLGYNHNIQSSYGVTAQIKTAIQHWIGSQIEREIL